jgi:hypothetical protein
MFVGDGARVFVLAQTGEFRMAEVIDLRFILHLFMA